MQQQDLLLIVKLINSYPFLKQALALAIAIEQRKFKLAREQQAILKQTLEKL